MISVAERGYRCLELFALQLFESKIKGVINALKSPLSSTRSTISTSKSSTTTTTWESTTTERSSKYKFYSGNRCWTDQHKLIRSAARGQRATLRDCFLLQTLDQHLRWLLSDHSSQRSAPILGQVDPSQCFPVHEEVNRPIRLQSRGLLLDGRSSKIPVQRLDCR